MATLKDYRITLSVAPDLKGLPKFVQSVKTALAEVQAAVSSQGSAERQERARTLSDSAKRIQAEKALLAEYNAEYKKSLKAGTEATKAAKAEELAAAAAATQSALDLVRKSQDDYKKARKAEAVATKSGKEEEIAAAKLATQAALDLTRKSQDAHKKARKAEVEATRAAKSEETAAARAESQAERELIKQNQDAHKKALKEEVDATKAAKAEETAAQRRLADFLNGSEREIKTATIREQHEILDATKNLTAQRAKGLRDNVKGIKEAEAKLADSIVAMAQKEAKATQDAYAKRINITKAGTAERLKLESELSQKLIALEGKTAAATQRAQRARQQPRGRAADEIGENFATISASVQSGSVSGLMGMMGPAAGAIGLVVDGVIALGGKLFEMGEAAIKVNNEWQIMNNLFIATNPGATAGQFEQIRVEMEALIRPLGVTQEQLAKLGQVVATFAAPDQIAGATEAILDLSRIQPGANLEQIAHDIADLEVATGSFGGAADLVAITALKLKDESLNPLGDASTNLIKVFNQAKLGMNDQAKAGQEAAATYTALVKSGLDAGEAAGAAEKLFRVLNDAANDPKTKDTLLKVLPEGLSLVEAGIENGNVSVLKFAEALQASGKSADEIAATLGPRLGGETLAALTTMFEQTGQSVTDFAAGFENIEGAAGRVATMLTPVSVQLAEIRTQRMDDMAQNFGEVLGGAVEGVKSGFGSLMEAVATMDFSALGGWVMYWMGFAIYLWIPAWRPNALSRHSRRSPVCKRGFANSEIV